MKKNNKKMFRSICVIGLSALFLVLVSSCGSTDDKGETYRNVQISDVTGTAQVDRTGSGVLDAYVGMVLQSEDVLTTGEESYLYLKMDEDKYAMMEPDSQARLVASGNSRDSKTSIYLEKGAIVNRLDVDLSEDSVYEINTPNSTMAVRGTNFRIEVRYDENGVSYTDVYVFEGTVACRLIYPDGSVDETEVSGHDGSGIQIKGDEQDTVYVVIDAEVDYEALPIETLEFLADVIKEGVSLSITQEDLESIIAEKKSNALQQDANETITSSSPEKEQATESPTLSPEKVIPTPSTTPKGVEPKNVSVPTPSATPALLPSPIRTPAPIEVESEQNEEHFDHSSHDSDSKNSESSYPTDKPAPEVSITPGDTPTPTEMPPTVQPTATAMPTATVQPTATAMPTATVQPTASATPTATATATPTATPMSGVDNPDSASD